MRLWVWSQILLMFSNYLFFPRYIVISFNSQRFPTTSRYKRRWIYISFKNHIFPPCLWNMIIFPPPRACQYLLLMRLFWLKKNSFPIYWIFSLQFAFIFYLYSFIQIVLCFLVPFFYFSLILHRPIAPYPFRGLWVGVNTVHAWKILIFFSSSSLIRLSSKIKSVNTDLEHCVSFPEAISIEIGVIGVPASREVRHQKY